MRLFARAGQSKWTRWWSGDLRVTAAGSYSADSAEPLNVTFLPGGDDSVPRPEDREVAYKLGRAAMKANRHGEAAARFESWSQIFAEDERASTAMYYAGTSRHQAGEEWLAIEWLTRMQERDHGHPWFLHASYWLGEAYANAGVCETALEYFEAVAWADPPEGSVWHDAAVSNIARISADDGEICSDWY